MKIIKYLHNVHVVNIHSAKILHPKMPKRSPTYIVAQCLIQWHSIYMYIGAYGACDVT